MVSKVKINPEKHTLAYAKYKGEKLIYTAEFDSVDTLVEFANEIFNDRLDGSVVNLPFVYMHGGKVGKIDYGDSSVRVSEAEHDPHESVIAYFIGKDDALAGGVTQLPSDALDAESAFTLIASAMHASGAHLVCIIHNDEIVSYSGAI